MRPCSKCGTCYPKESFKRKSAICRRCHTIYEVPRAYQKRHPNGVQLRLFGSTEYERRVKAAARAWAWNKEHPEVVRRLTRKRRAKMARRNGRSMGLTRASIAEKMAYWNNACWCCGVVATQVDHVKPVAKGGPHLLANLRPICGPCNRTKSDKWPIEIRSAS